RGHMVGALERHHPLLGARAELAVDGGPVAGPGEVVLEHSHVVTAHPRSQHAVTHVVGVTGIAVTGAVAHLPDRYPSARGIAGRAGPGALGRGRSRPGGRV